MLGKPKFGVNAVSITSVFILSYFKELSDIEFVLIPRSLMYSMFDLLFETPSYRPVYVISDSEMKDLTFLSLTNKTLDLPKNVISAGINSTSQFNTIKKFLDTYKYKEQFF